MLRVAIIGCGLIGFKRAEAIAGVGNLVACADIDFQKAQFLAAQHNCAAFENWEELIGVHQIDVAIISVRHNKLAEIAEACMRKKINVFVEKPAAKKSVELENLSLLAQESTVKFRVGFNHRYHPALQKAKELVVSGAIGELLYVRGCYGHGGRLGYESEWRANPSISGGGELIDQGSHLIDLARWFLGDLEVHSSLAASCFWDMQVDDNAFLLLKTAAGQVAMLHASCTEWKNMFSFEIYGVQGKLHIRGLGGSYGTEEITYYRMRPEMGPPDTMSWQFPMKDNSWRRELEEFVSDIINDVPSIPGIEDAMCNLRIIEEVYNKNGYDFSS